MGSCGAGLTLALCALGAAVSTVSAQASGGWPLHGLDLGGRRFSPLTQIDTATVRRLEPRWTYHSGVEATFQATPIVVDSVMFVSLPFSGVVALDARTGRELWRYEHRPRSQTLCCGPANRGVAVAGGKDVEGTILPAGPVLVGRVRLTMLWRLG